MSTELTDARGERYGTPLKHFNCTQSMYAEWVRSRIQTNSGPLRNDVANGVNHAVYMIIDKLARASEDPTHIVELQRMREIAQAIERYVDAGFYPPRAWLDELEDLCTKSSLPLLVKEFSACAKCSDMPDGYKLCDECVSRRSMEGDEA